MKEEKFDYTQAMARLEAIAKKVEDPATGLDDIDALIKESASLVAECREYLRSAAGKAGAVTDNIKEI